MKKRKGSALILVITFFAVFVSIYIFVSALNASNMLSSAVEYQSGDVEVLAQSQVQKHNLKDQYRPAINYSLNNAAFDEGRSNRWLNIPSQSSLRSSYFGNTRDRFHERFSKITMCQVPQIGLQMSPDSYTAELEGEPVQCSRSHTTVNNYFREDVSVQNPKNRFLKLSDYAIRASENFRDGMPGSIEGSGSDTGYCGESYSSVASGAESDAKSDAVSGLSYGSEALDETEEVEGTSTSQSTSYSGSYSTVQTDSSRCCEEYGEAEEPGELPPCIEHDQRYSADSDFTATQAEFSVSITDTENELEYSGGTENLEYDAEYVYSFN